MCSTRGKTWIITLMCIKRPPFRFKENKSIFTYYYLALHWKQKIKIKLKVVVPKGAICKLTLLGMKMEIYDSEVVLNDTLFKDVNGYVKIKTVTRKPDFWCKPKVLNSLSRKLQKMQIDKLQYPLDIVLEIYLLNSKFFVKIFYY